MTGVAGLVLAAGHASRMGGRKLDLAWGDGTLLEAALACLLDAGLSPVMVVLGPSTVPLADRVIARGARWTLNDRPDDGMLASVQRGLAALGDVAGVAVLPGDHPAVSAATVHRLTAALRPGGIVVPTYRGRHGHPMILAGELLPEVAGLDSAVGLRQLRDRLPERVTWLEVDDGGVLVDLDTPADYRAGLASQADLQRSQEDCNKRRSDSP